MPNLSLTMIVRDEEALLPGCLASVRGVVDEVIVVDTGSRDGTRGVAERAGARVVDFVWCDDFAAARNLALHHARGKWVLVLDADERLGPGARSGLRSAISRGTFDCGMLRLHDASRLDAPAEEVIAGRARMAEVQLVPRLLRRVDGLAFVDPIHENVLPWLRRRGMKIAGVDVDIVHLGATRDVVDAKGKLERNVRLLRARIERNARDVSAHGYLAHDLMRAGDLPGAMEVAARGWQAVEEGAESFSSVHRVATAYAYLLIGQGRHEQARRVVTAATSMEGQNPDFTFFMAYSRESEAMTETGSTRRIELLVEARAGYEACVSFGARVFAQSFVVGARTWYGLARLGTVDLQLGRPADAARCFDAALAHDPGYRLALLGKAEALVDGGQATLALARLEKLLDDGPDAWTLAASAARAIGRDEDARLFATRAVRLARRGFVGSHRRPRLAGLVVALGLASTHGGSSLTAGVIGELA